MERAAPYLLAPNAPVVAPRAGRRLVDDVPTYLARTKSLDPTAKTVRLLAGRIAPEDSPF